jgi:GWxTD domain-containing protein
MSRRIYSFLPILASTVLLVSYSASGQTRSTVPGNASGAEDYAVPARLNQPYFDWLNEDVSYIISPEERGAFLQLIKDDDRDRFIEQFWQRRNPDPDTQDNPFESEHYRRLAYSNGHFSTGSTRGWKTDRGRVYIQCGQPDEVESNETGIDGHVETWGYRYLEGLGENVSFRFLDLGRVNDYRLVLEPDERSYLFHAEVSDVCSEDLGCADVNRNLAQLDPDDSPNFDIRFKELEAAISERAELNDIHFSSHFDSVPVTSFTTLVPVTIEIPSFEFQAQSSESGQAVQLHLFLRITDSMGRVVETFEDAVPGVAGLAEVQASERPFLVQKNIALRPGTYLAAIALGNPELGTIGTHFSDLTVPAVSNQK